MVNGAQNELKSSYDAVVIGAGIGGLVAGCLLAQAGESVLILEQTDAPGGTQGAITDGPWRWDLGSGYCGDANEGGLLRRILKLCGAGSIEFKALSDPFDEVQIDGDVYHYYRNRARFFGILRARFPAEKEGIDRYERLLEEGERYERAMTSRARTPMAIRLLRNPTYARFAQREFGDFLKNSMQDRTLRTLLCAQHMSYMEDPTRIATALNVSMHNHLFRSGAWYPARGMAAIPEALEDAFLNAGGTIAYGATVDQIEIKNQTARGVRACFNGERRPFFISSHIVVSNADTSRTIHEYAGSEYFQPKVAAKYVPEANSFPVVALHLGLKIPPEEAPFESKTYWWYENVDFVRYYEALRRGSWPRHLAAYMGSGTAKGTPGEHAPPGHSTLSIVSPAPKNFAMWGVDVDASTSREQLAERLDNDEYRVACARIRARLMALVERRFPGMEDKIVIEKLMTPPEFASTFGAISGSVYGLTGTPEYFGHNRPGVRTDVVGLYLCGSSNRPGFAPLGAAISGVVAADVIADRGYRHVLAR